MLKRFTVTIEVTKHVDVDTYAIDEHSAIEAALDGFDGDDYVASQEYGVCSVKEVPK